MLGAWVLHRRPSAARAENSLLRFEKTWAAYIRNEKDPWQEMAEWIRGNIDRKAVILAPPWEDSFWLQAERAEVVNFKEQPHNAQILAWHERLQAVNGGPFRSRGADVEQELRQHYAGLSAEQIERIHKLYGADFYLTTRPQGELAAWLVHKNGSYYLYDLGK